MLTATRNRPSGRYPCSPRAVTAACRLTEEALGRIDARIQFARDYGAVLEKIAQDQQFLHENRATIGSDEFEPAQAAYGRA